MPRATPLLLDWRLGKSHPFRPAGDEEYAGPPIVPVGFAVGAQLVSLGEHSGTTTPLSASYCLDLGWHRTAPSSETTPTSAAMRSVVSRLSLETMQGDSDFMIVRDGMSLHVLHRETSDGRCDTAKQGPLDVCEGFEWERAAEFRLAADANLYERVDAENAPLDCSAPMPWGGEKLSPS